MPSAPVGPLARALVEALESVAARDQVRSLVRGALLTARLETIPEDAATFRRFTHVVLRASLERTLGAGAAELVLEQLDHVVGTMAPRVQQVRLATGTTDDDGDEPSGERSVESLPPPVRETATTVPAMPRAAKPDLASFLPSTEPLEAPALFPRATSYESGTQPKRALGRVVQPRPSREIEEVRPSSSGPRALATDVIVISLDPRVATEVEARLRGRSRVRSVVTAPELVAAFAASTGGRIAIVLDTGVPSIDLATFVGLSPAFPPGAHVVLWGTDERHKARLVHVFPQVASWSASGTFESPADVLLAE